MERVWFRRRRVASSATLFRITHSRLQMHYFSPRCVVFHTHFYKYFFTFFLHFFHIRAFLACLFLLLLFFFFLLLLLLLPVYDFMTLTPVSGATVLLLYKFQCCSQSFISFKYLVDLAFFAFVRLCAWLCLAVFASVASLLLRCDIDASQPVAAAWKCVKK